MLFFLRNFDRVLLVEVVWLIWFFIMLNPECYLLSSFLLQCFLMQLIECIKFFILEGFPVSVRYWAICLVFMLLFLVGVDILWCLSTSYLYSLFSFRIVVVFSFYNVSWISLCFCFLLRLCSRSFVSSIISVRVGVSLILLFQQFFDL